MSINLTLSSGANLNYVAKVVTLRHVRKHIKADRLQCAIIDGNNIIVGLSEKEGDLGIYFPLESQIQPWFLKKHNLYKDPGNNADPEAKPGFFEPNGRVKALKLREERSEGFWIPISYLEENPNLNFWQKAAQDRLEFDTVNGELLVKKYVVTFKNQKSEPRNPKEKKDQVRKKDLLVEGQFNFHKDTPQLGKNIHRFLPDDDISITVKKHGTSLVSSMVRVKKRLSWLERAAKWLGVKVEETEYKNLYASRKVIKNLGTNGSGYYKTDVWGAANNLIKDCLKPEMTVYAEIVGYLPDSQEMIQKHYDYGCEPGTFQVDIYRITTTTSCGDVFEWDSRQVELWCQKMGLNYVPVLFRGKAKDILPKPEEMSLEEWQEKLLETLKVKYLEKKSWLCKNDVWDEGIVVRKDNSFEFDVYKLKSFYFMQHETKMLDTGVLDLESENCLEDGDLYHPEDEMGEVDQSLNGQ